jgi:hypothetical protein
MKNVLSILAAGGLVLASAVPLKAQDSVAVFRPAGPWTADFGDDYCRLSRNFSTGSDTVSLAFERVRPGTTTNLILVGNGIKIFRTADELGLTFLPAQAERSLRYVRSQTPDGKQYLNFGNVTLAPAPVFTPGARPAGPPPASAGGAGGRPPGPPAYDRAAEQAVGKTITGVAMAKGLTAPVRIETGDLGEPFHVLQQCADDLVKSWGVDPAVAAAIPEGGGAGWLPQNTIPFVDFGKFGGGANQVRLMVDASGKPTKCVIFRPTLAQALNDKVCSLLMQNGKFIPARNAAGEAVPSYWMGSPQFLGPAFGGRR